MNDEAAVYDLGEVAVGGKRPRRSPAPATRIDDRNRIQGAWPVSFALFVPGTGHFLRGDLRLGLFYLSAMGFFGALGWAILETIDRLGATLTLFGLSRGIGPWTLGAIFILASTTYVANVCSAIESRIAPDVQRAPPPLITGIASALIPGWGQALAGHRLTAALFLFGCCIVGAAWILASSQMLSLLDSQGLYLPRPLEILVSPLARWTLPAILWSLALYDAIFRATLRR